MENANLNKLPSIKVENENKEVLRAVAVLLEISTHVEENLVATLKIPLEKAYNMTEKSIITKEGF